MARCSGATHAQLKHLVQLRIVREANLPDSYTNVLKVRRLYLTEEHLFKFFYAV